MRFDWYQATIAENPIVIVDTLKNALAVNGSVVEGRGRHNYHQSFRILDSAGNRLAEVLAGGANGNPNVMASGEDTPNFVSVIRNCWPVHRVTRFDSAEDFAEQGALEGLESICRGVAKDLNIKGRTVVPDDPTEGRTYYLGAPSSDTRVRLYDKTAESRAKLPESRHSDVPDNWARLEIQVRPRKEWRAYAAQATPEQAWGFSRWTHVLAERALSLSIDRINMYLGKESDDERAFRFMVKQYGRVLERMFRDVGTWECVGLSIRDAIDAEKKNKKN